MTGGIRISIVALLTLFVAGLAVHSAYATEMPLKMILGDGGSVKMADCQGCGDGDDDSAPSCDIVCMVTFAATIGPAADTVRPYFAASFSRQVVGSLNGRTGPPDPFPPRVLI